MTDFSYRKQFRKQVNMTTNRLASEINIGKPIDCVELSPFDFSSNAVALASGDCLYFYELRFSEDATFGPSRCVLINQVKFGKNFNCGILAFSPKTDLTKVPKQFSVVCADTSQSAFRYYSTDKINSVVIFTGHDLPINDLVMEPRTGVMVASVADDKKCIVSSLENQIINLYRLQSPGVGVAWHRNFEHKLLIAERSGVITLYDNRNARADRCFNSNMQPLTGIKWCPLDDERICTVAGRRLALWNINNTSQPIEAFVLDHEGTRFRFSHVDKDVFVARTVGTKETSIHAKNLGILLFSDMPMGNSLSFHARYHMFVLDELEKLYFIRVIG